MTLHTRPCPCCGDTDEPRHFLHAVRLAPITGVTVINDYDVAQCTLCGCTFATDIPDQRTVSAYYAAADKYTTVSPTDAARHKKTADAIRQTLRPEGAIILDVGAGAGGLAAALAEGPMPLRVTSVNSLDDLTSDDWSRGFDGVILSGVLEHVVDVQPLLRQIRRLLMPTGWLWTEVPDAGGWLMAGPVAAPFQELSSEHITYFTGATLRRTLESAGFQMEGFDQSVIRQTPTQAAAHLTMWARPRDVQDARASIEQYLAASQADLARYIAAAAALPNPCILWGAGTLTRRLWPHLNDKAAFVTDSNPAYYGRTLGDVPIVSPATARALAITNALPVIALTQGAAQAIQADAAALGLTATALLDYVPR